MKWWGEQKVMQSEKRREGKASRAGQTWRQWWDDRRQEKRLWSLHGLDVCKPNSEEEPRRETQ
jgi:hypothetical protein